MHRSDHKAVVALGIAVVQVHAEETAVPADEGRREGRLLVGIEHMREVEGDAEVRQTDFLQREQRRRAIRHQADGTAVRLACIRC